MNGSQEHCFNTVKSVCAILEQVVDTVSLKTLLLINTGLHELCHCTPHST